MKAGTTKNVSGRGLQGRVVWLPRDELKPFPGNPRRHPEAQIAKLSKIIGERGWTVPILTDEAGTILAGHLRAKVAERLGMAQVPTLMIKGLSEAEKRAIVISDNRLPEQAEWDFELLRAHFEKLIELDFDVELTGFSTGEVDLLLDGRPTVQATDLADEFSGTVNHSPAVSRAGDIWQLGRHRLMCADALRRDSYDSLLGTDRVQMVVADPPYNVSIRATVGRGKIRHREFAMATGEMSPPEYAGFLDSFLRLVIAFSVDGAISYTFIDWRHAHAFLSAALPLFSEFKNLLVWNKDNPGLGTFYRSKHELICVFKNGAAPHINNFKLGATRYRTNVLDYPSVNSLHPGRAGDRELHPTVKPIALIADLMRDCSRRNGIILDPFCGSGTTIVAAERTGRIARAIEIDPVYVDVAIRRWQKFTNDCARHAELRLTFEEVAHKRASESQQDQAAPLPAKLGGKKS